jgi:hypothetical protein
MFVAKYFVFIFAAAFQNCLSPPFKKVRSGNKVCDVGYKWRGSSAGPDERFLTFIGISTSRASSTLEHRIHNP